MDVRTGTDPPRLQKRKSKTFDLLRRVFSLGAPAAPELAGMDTNLPLETRMLAMIALFEGSGGGRINTWDEQLLSLGTLHFAVGQGVGARFLARVHELDPAGYLACLGDQCTDATKRGVPAIQAFCRVNIWKTRTWQPAFTALSRLDAYRQADREFAKPYLDSAKVIARRYGLTSERGLAWALDRCVQQGGGVRPAVERAYAGVKGKDEVTVMSTLANAYASSANPKYAGTVRARSLTVAFGTSARTGYPGSVDLLRDFGLRGNVAWDQPTPTPGVPTLFLEDGGGKNVTWNGDETLAYQGQPLTRAWLSGLALVYPAGTKTQVTTPNGKTLIIEIYEDGAVQLRRA